jgi:RNA polymerase sigma factor (sigma-70 family)
MTGTVQQATQRPETTTEKFTREEGAKSGPVTVNWTALVEQVRSGEDAGMEEIYKLFERGIRYYLHRQVGSQELEDRVHDTFLIVIKAIRNDGIREPERLMGFIRTVVRRQVAGYIDDAVKARREEVELETGVTVADRTENPEQVAMIQERVSLMKSSLAALSDRDREILVRFYLKEEPVEKICQEMSLTETQFRLFKSRAKAKFGEIGQKKIKIRKIFLG